MADVTANLPIGLQVSLPGHFNVPVVLEAARPLGKGFECRVRLPDGTLDEAVLSAEEAATLAGTAPSAATRTPLANADQLRLLVESARIRLADDPGAGKTIMAGLLIQEMKLREAIDRVLILRPSPLTIQWQDEMLRWFGESFDMIFAAVDQQQLTNPWQRSNQVIASIDHAKQDDVRGRVWQERWDLVILDEAHKCSAYTKSSTGRGDEVAKTKRYQLAEHLTAQAAGHVVLLTATPHHGDDDRFAHFLRLLDPDLFPEPHRVAAKAGEIRRDILRLGPDCPWALRRLKEDLRDMEGRRLFPDRHAHTIAFRLNRDEYDLYKAVTAYINEFLPQASGRKKQSVALIRTVLQRRLASSTLAIFESIRRRLEKQQALLTELEDLPPAQRARQLAQLQGRVTDAEQDEDDLDEAERDHLTDEFTTALELDLFSGGGAIPLEAARLGCESHALDYNPVAHLIELCTLVYPQRFRTTLADDLERWGRKVLERVRKATEDLSPQVRIPGSAQVLEQVEFFGEVAGGVASGQQCQPVKRNNKRDRSS